MDYLNILAVIVMSSFTVYWIFVKNIPNKLLYILFAAVPIFSGNFELSFFRPMYQSLLVIILLLNIIYWIKRGMTFTPVAFFLFSYLGLILLSYIDNNIINKYFMSSLVNYLMIMSTLFYIFKKINTKEKIYKLMDFISYLSLILGIFSIVEKILLGGRTEVTFTNPNYLAFTLGIGFTWILFVNTSKWKFIYLIVIAMGIFATSSRIVILAILLLSFIYFVASLKKKSFYKLLPFYIILGVVFVLAFQNFGENRFGTDAADSSDGERTAIMLVSIEIMKEEPVNGIGYGQFIEKFSDYLPYEDPAIRTLYTRDKIVTHNDYLRIIDELGIPSFILLLIFISYIFYKSVKKDTIFIYLFIYVLSFSVAHNNMNALMFWFLLLLPIHYLTLEKKDRERAVLENS